MRANREPFENENASSLPIAARRGQERPERRKFLFQQKVVVRFGLMGREKEERKDRAE